MDARLGKRGQKRLQTAEMKFLKTVSGLKLVSKIRVIILKHK
jgi:hypothetical protein